MGSKEDARVSWGRGQQCGKAQRGDARSGERLEEAEVQADRVRWPQRWVERVRF